MAESSITSTRSKFVLGSRKSQLAQVQTFIVRDALASLFPNMTFDLEFMSTGGDKNQTQALYLLGGKGLWTEELEVALNEKRIDLIVHSLKDIPTQLPDNCEIGAIMKREDPVDCLVVKQGLPYKSLEELPEGSVVGTSSVRRVAQLRRAFPKLKFTDVRGNLNTRLAKLDDPNSDYSAIILAKAGLVRLDMASRITSTIAFPTLLHAVGQGALGIEIRSDDPEVKELVAKLADHDTTMKCVAERACLRKLEGGCSVPVGVNSTIENGSLSLTGCVTSLDGTSHVQFNLTKEVKLAKDAEDLGTEVAKELLSQGAEKILEEVKKDRNERIAKAEGSKEHGHVHVQVQA
jgi:hydroxymethylbilane synthase